MLPFIKESTTITAIEEATTVDIAAIDPIKQAAIAAIKKSVTAAGNIIAAKIAAGNKARRPVTNLILRISNMSKLPSMNVDAHTRVSGLAD